MDKKIYKKRIIDSKVQEYLESFGAVCVEGPKWCGKTWTSSFHSNSEIYIGDPTGNFQNRRLASISPKTVLEGDAPHLIDEWQEVPELWDAVRHEVDKRNAKGQFIMTGSATPNRKGMMHSGAGRIATIRMRPMSLYETGVSSGTISLEDICNGEYKDVLTGEVDLKTIIDSIVRGGWPANQDIDLDKAALLPKEYMKVFVSDDIDRVDGIKRDKHKMELLLRSLARNESTTVTNQKIKNDIKEIDNDDIVVETVASYLNLLERMFLIDNQKPFGNTIRSSVRIKQAEKRHFADPSLACALLNATPEMLLGDLNTLGFLFEALCERDLKIYAESFGAQLYHYQDYRNKEIDAVVELPSGDWCAIEIKLGANQIDTAAKSLLNISDSIKKEKNGKPPKSLVVVCGLTNAAYKREDGVYVVPITALRP